MSLELISIGSSSSGNSYLIMAEGHVMLLDVGLPAKTILGALEHLGIDPSDVEAVLVTHEHGDHVRSVRAISRKCGNAAFFASRGTVANSECFSHVPEDRLHLVEAGDVISTGGPDGSCSTSSVRIGVFPLSHDAAEPVGFTVESGEEKLAVVTDTGIITDEIYEAVRGANTLVFEANHDADMLLYGEYPYKVKLRIKSDLGHLSNEYAAGMLSRLLEERREIFDADRKPLRIMLGHLSFHNNMPLFARQTVEDALRAAGFKNGGDYTLDVAAKEGLTFMPGGVSTNA